MKTTTPGDDHDHNNEHEPVHKHETKEGEEPQSKKTKKKMKMRRVGKVWVLDCSVTRDFIARDSSVFSRQDM